MNPFEVMDRVRPLLVLARDRERAAVERAEYHTRNHRLARELHGDDSFEAALAQAVALAAQETLTQAHTHVERLEQLSRWPAGK